MMRKIIQETVGDHRCRRCGGDFRRELTVCVGVSRFSFVQCRLNTVVVFGGVVDGVDGDQMWALIE